MQPVKLKYEPHIDGLRAIAVISVVIYHAFPAALPGGFIGVDVFFVISGFLISAILYAEFASPQSRGGGIIANFYGRRIRRIFPALVVVLIACWILGYRLLLPTELKRLAVNSTAAAGFYSNFLFARETGYFNSESATNPLIHLWSLAVEEQFYLLWPLVIWLVFRCRIKILPAAVFLVAFLYFWNAQHPQTQASAAFFLPQTRLWELMAGAIAAALFPLLPQASGDYGRGVPHSGPPSPGGLLRMDGAHLANLLALIGISLIGLGALLITNETIFPSKWTLLPTIGAACMVCSGGGAWINRKVLSRRMLVGIGLISYPLYLWHWPLLAFSQLAFVRPDLFWLKSAVLLGAALLACGTYLFVERPIRHGPHVRRKVGILVFAMLAAAGIGYFTFLEEGFPARFPPIVQELSQFNYDPVTSQRPGYFLQLGEDETDFKSTSDDTENPKPVLYIWGDSHAAALYPGIEAYFGDRYRIVQRTAATLPPFLRESFNRLTSRPRVNRFVLDSIIKDKAACVVLEANWPTYDWPEVEGTIADLRLAGIRHIVLVGPVPQWYASLPQQLCNYMRRHATEPVPARLKTGMKPEPLETDAKMAAFSERLGIDYISPCKILVDKDGCLIRVGDTADSLIAFDYGHLTEAGSKYLVSHFQKF